MPDVRIKQAQRPFDGKFRTDVVVQSKSDPLDFLPCGPFSALFGASPLTNTGMELQHAREHLGTETPRGRRGTVREGFRSEGAGAAKLDADARFNRPLWAINGGRPAFVKPVHAMFSREAAVRYAKPLRLALQMGIHRHDVLPAGNCS